MPKLGPALLRRFETDEGYKPFPEALTCCERNALPEALIPQMVADHVVPVVRLRREGKVKTSIVTNADPRICQFFVPTLTFPSR